MVIEKECNVFDEFRLNKILLHQVNCLGVMGAGFAFQVKSKFPKCYEEYKKIASKEMLGKIFMYRQGDIMICNAFGLVGISRSLKMTDYNAWNSILEDLIAEIDSLEKNTDKKWSVVCPAYIGCGLAGGDWSVMKKILSKFFTKHDLTICYFK